MGTLLVFVGFFAFCFGVIRLIRAFLKKSPKKPELLFILGSCLLFFAGGYLIEPERPQMAHTNISNTHKKNSISSTSSSSSEDTKASKELAKKKEIVEKNKQKQALISFNNQIKQDNTKLTNLEYSGTQTIDVNNNQPTFTKDDLSLVNKAWEKYGDLDSLNRATSAEAMLNQSLMPTAKRGDISNVSPTGWHNKKLDKGYLYNRSHLIGYALSGENANWKNLITGTTQLNNPEMLRYEMDIKYYLERSKDNYVRYSVTPVFRGKELLARGVHLMAQSINSDEIKFNVYIFNIQDGVTLNYSDGTSQTKNETLEAKQKEIEKKNAEIERKNAEAKAQQESKNAEKEVQEQQASASTNSGQEYIDANGNGLIKGSNNGIYHIPGSKYYSRTTNPAAWFKTIEEAEQAGYRAPMN